MVQPIFISVQRYYDDAWQLHILIGIEYRPRIPYTAYSRYTKSSRDRNGFGHFIYLSENFSAELTIFKIKCILIYGNHQSQCNFLVLRQWNFSDLPMNSEILAFLDATNTPFSAVAVIISKTIRRILYSLYSEHLKTGDFDRTNSFHLMILYVHTLVPISNYCSVSKHAWRYYIRPYNSQQDKSSEMFQWLRPRRR